MEDGGVDTTVLDGQALGGICLGVFRFEIGALRKKLGQLGQISEFRD